MTIEDRIRALTQPMLRKKFFVVLSSGKGLDLKPHLPAHLEYMIALEKSGVLFASGPLSGTMGDGLTILRAESAEVARAIASCDPLVANGLRNFELREWTLMEGSLGVTVNFSNQSIEVR